MFKLLQLPLLPVFVAIGAAGFTLGLILPVTTVVLEGMAVSIPLIGFIGNLVSLGMLAGSFFVGRAILNYGVRAVLGAGLLLTVVAVGALSLWLYLPYWVLLRFIVGIGMAGVFTASETLINRSCNEGNRGRTLGLYGMAFSLSFMFGPVGLFMLNYGYRLPFIAGALVCLLPALIVLRFLRLSGPELPVEKGTGKILLRRISLSLSTMLLAGFMEGALLVLIPLYTLRQGFSMGETGVLLFCFLLGHGCIPLVAGIACDRWGFPRTLSAVIMVGIPAFLLVPFTSQYVALLMLFVVCGASVGPLYPLSIGLLANELTPTELPRGNAMTTFCYGLGSVLGPVVPALVMHFTGVSSLFLVAAFVYIIFFGVRFSNLKLGKPVG
jgi:MFS family permease